MVRVLGGGLFVTPNYEQEQTQTVTFTSDFESTSTPLCGGNDVSFSSTARFLYHETIDENDKSINILT